MRTYDLDFDNLSVSDKLEILLASPQLRAIAGELPTIGGKTKPALTDTVGTLVLGASTFLFGSDRKADAELRAQWSRIGGDMNRYGVAAPREPVSSRVFRAYRDEHLADQKLLDHLGEVFMETSVGMAKDLRLFPESAPGVNTLMHPGKDNIIYADGTYFAPISSVKPGEKGRVVADAEKMFKGWGYNYVFNFVRGDETRRRIVLGLGRAKASREMEIVIGQVERLRSLVGPDLHALVFDGALCGTHKRELAKLGVPTVNKPDGVRSIYNWKSKPGTKPDGRPGVITFECDGCTHDTNLVAGVWWELIHGKDGGLVRRRAIDFVDVRRSTDSFEIDLAIACDKADGGRHVVTVDAMGHAKFSNKKGKVSIPDQTNLLPLNDPHAVTIYGRRNDSESFFNMIKNSWAMAGSRAQSWTVQRLELDLLLAGCISNAINWTEHGPRQGVLPMGVGECRAAEDRIAARRAA